jgi:hypothetical protein
MRGRRSILSFSPLAAAITSYHKSHFLRYVSTCVKRGDQASSTHLTIPSI